MLDIQTIDDCLGFLNRTPLNGSEVPAFVNLTNRLHYLRAHLVSEAEKEKTAAPPAPPTKLSRRKAQPILPG